MLAPSLVLVTGPPGAGKSTLAPRLADELGAVCISRDAIHNMVFDAWEPLHPLLSEVPDRGPSRLNEGKLNWDIFLWTLAQIAPRAAVVGETPLNHAINRTRLRDLRAQLAVPVIEVFLSGDPAELMKRVERRAQLPDAHPIKIHFTIEGARTLLAGPYLPLLEDAAVIRLDTSDFSTLDVVGLARKVRDRVDAWR